MSMLPDPAELASVADRIEQHASAARRRAATLDAAVVATGWHGAAAEMFTDEAHLVVAALRGSARRLEAAGQALRRHATRVAETLDDLARLRSDGLQVVEDLFSHPGQLLGDGKRLFEDVADAVGL